MPDDRPESPGLPETAHVVEAILAACPQLHVAQARAAALNVRAVLVALSAARPSSPEMCPTCGSRRTPTLTVCSDSFHVARPSSPTPEEVLASAKSVTRLCCECENPDRNSYRGRDGDWHCFQCDGLMPGDDATTKEGR